MPMRVRKAVLPAAGLGTRLLPATKAQPKEMLPIVDKPTIQYVVEEAAAAGLTELLMVVTDDAHQTVIGVQSMPTQELERYGVVAPAHRGPGVMPLEGIVEKPPA